MKKVVAPIEPFPRGANLTRGVSLGIAMRRLSTIDLSGSEKAFPSGCFI
jgi:hypothetical protein